MATSGRFGSYVHQPLVSLPVLPDGATEVITLGPEGCAEWRAVPSDVTPVRVTITTTSAWHLCEPSFTIMANAKGSDVACLSVGKGLDYLTLFWNAKQSITMAVQ